MIASHIDTARFQLRPFREGDAAAVYAYWQSDPGWARFNRSVPDHFTESDAVAFVTGLLQRDRRVQPSWAICAGLSVMGIVSLTFEEAHRIAVIGYGVHGRLRGQGTCAEACRAVITAAFAAVPELAKIRAHTDARNVGSIRVLEKLGFAREGLLRANQLVDGVLQDEAIYGVLRGEWLGALGPEQKRAEP